MDVRCDREGGITSEMNTSEDNKSGRKGQRNKQGSMER